MTGALTDHQGNHYCSRDYGNDSNSYHYSNQYAPFPTPSTMNSQIRYPILTKQPTTPRNGSYYYSNPNGSTYYNNGQGGSTYTAPSGNSYSSGYGSGSSSGNSGSSGSQSKK